MSQVRVRFAPSPTGFFHIGSARTALFNWLYARHTGGVFILRIEDTDKERNSEAFLNLIYESLQWLGLNWDEGPQVGGAYGPYRQSERAHVYKEYLEKLTASGRTYEKDGAIYFKLLGERSEVYDEHRRKTVTKVKNSPAVIDDQIRGRVERLEDEDFVIVRSDGNPVFHFVNVVDDIAMGITHVIRGEDHLSNTSKHVELFKAFGAPVPIYAHIPLILKQNGQGKMSKRDQGALIEEYQRRGYLSEALVNFLCLLGWSPKNDLEKLPIEEIIRLFDLPGVTQSNARFDDKKLSHMNMAYLHDMPADRFVAAATVYLNRQNVFAAGAPESGYLHDVLVLCQPKIRAIEDLPGFIGYFFSESYAIDPKAKDKIFGKGDPRARLAELLEVLPTADFSTDASLEQTVQSLATAKGNGTGDYIHPGRLAVSGMSVGPSFYGLLRVLGRERAVARIQRFLANA